MGLPDWLIKILGHRIADKLGLQEGTVDETKNWWASKGVWTGIVTALMGLYVTLSGQFHWPVVPEWIFTLLGAIGVYSRVSADTKIG